MKILDKEYSYFDILHQALTFPEAVEVVVIIFIIVIPLSLKFLSMLQTSRISKSDKQFDTLMRIIEDESFTEKLKSAPFLVKQLTFENFYSLRNYQTTEIEFLLEQSCLPLDLNQIDTLKKGKVLLFCNNKYQLNMNWLHRFWSKKIIWKGILIGFIFLFISVIALLLIQNFASYTLIYILALIGFVTIEFNLIFKHEAIKTYSKEEFAIQSLIEKSELFENNQGTNNT
ncbi:hypothetical protein ES754_05185 [Psychrobacter frigidicola]|uniref:Uncharacterized protein n=1 Tax=Psychrobacter frigidicola TaxID=45611 RepID=A0A5C7A4H1_9GAMM|nr:hypothetical protein [Psychrobacter frigidicola]TXD98321.1 hypothetical protein ES754_05185 [Psychrobacter frigidicola]